MEAEQSMGTAATRAKQRWNGEHYQQVKVYAAPDVAKDFKALCEAGGISVSAEISRFMAEKIGRSVKAHAKKDPLATRGLRRKSLAAIIAGLYAMRDAEERYRDNIPENLQSSEAHEKADEAVSALEEAIGLLEGVY
jgi:hypothetical protein